MTHGCAVQPPPRRALRRQGAPRQQGEAAAGWRGWQVAWLTNISFGHYARCQITRSFAEGVRGAGCGTARNSVGGVSSLAWIHPSGCGYGFWLRKGQVAAQNCTRNQGLHPEGTATGACRCAYDLVVPSRAGTWEVRSQLRHHSLRAPLHGARWVPSIGWTVAGEAGCAWARWGSNPRPRDYESPALTAELRALGLLSPSSPT